MRVFVLLNQRAGRRRRTATMAERIKALFEGLGVEAVVVMAKGKQVADVAKRAARLDVDAVVAAGGDGTVSAVAAALRGSGKPLGILPIGTRNHFARDLSLPLTLEDSARVIASGEARDVDLGEVNGRPFVNNSSIGLYPSLVEERDRHRWRGPAGKVLALVRASLREFTRHRPLQVLVASGGKSLARQTPFVFVGNNEYSVRPFREKRERLDSGRLHVWLAGPRAPRKNLMLLALALMGKARRARYLDAVSLPELWVDTGKRTVKVAVDGEVVRMRAPLHYAVRPRALRVLAPGGAQGEAPA